MFEKVAYVLDEHGGLLSRFLMWNLLAYMAYVDLYHTKINILGF